jgi:HK97 family phage major capsid protein
MTALQLRQKRAKIAADAALLIPKTGSISPEDKRKFDLMMFECDSLKSEIEAAERSAEGGDERSQLERLEGELRQTRRPNEAPLGDGFDEAVNSASQRRYARAFSSYLRNGLNPTERGGRGVSDEDRSVMLSRRETRDMGVGTGSEGGFFVPQSFSYQVEEAMKYFGPMLQCSTVMDTSTGAPLPWPTSNDTTVVGEQLAENTQVSAADVTLSSITFNAWKYSTKLVKVSLELVQDSAFDMEQWLSREFAIRLGRILNTKFTVGVGTTEPNGIVTAAAAGPTAVGASANTGGSDSATNTIGSIDVVELEHSIDVAYRPGASYMMNDGTLKALKEVLDKYGRPLWKPGLASGDPDTINGYPYWINNDVATLAASAKTVLFGQMKKYLVRRVKSLQVLRLSERYADYGQIAFIGFARYDGNLLDAGTHPVKYLIQHS